MSRSHLHDAVTSSAAGSGVVFSKQALLRAGIVLYGVKLTLAIRTAAHARDPSKV